MTSLQTHNNSGRKKLVIGKLLGKRSVPGKQGNFDVLDFNAKIEGENAIVKYSVSASGLFDFIKSDAIIECDVQVTIPEGKDGKPLVDNEGNPYHNRKITQIFQEGQPVKGQGKQWGKSPETVAMEIDSKFRDTALMQACEFMNDVPDITAEHVLSTADKFYAWLKGGKARINPVEKLMAKESVEPEGEKPVASPTESQVGIPEFKDGTDLVNYALKHGFKLVSIKETLWIKTPADIKDVAVAAKTLFPQGVR